MSRRVGDFEVSAGVDDPDRRGVLPPFARGPLGFVVAMRASRADRLFLVVAACAIAKPVYAYIDPGAGSVMLQVLIAGGIGVAIKLRRFFIAALRRVAGSLKK